MRIGACFLLVLCHERCCRILGRVNEQHEAITRPSYDSDLDTQQSLLVANKEERSNRRHTRRKLTHNENFDGLDFVDTLRSKSTETETLEVFEADDDNLFAPYTLRHLSIFLGLTIRGGPNQFSFDSAAVALMAIRDWNSGRHSIVSEIGSATSSECPDLKFTFEYFNTEYSPLVASRYLADDVLSRRRKPPDPLQPCPTSILGMSRSAVSSPMAILGGIYSIPQFSHGATSSQLDNKELHPYFGRLVPSVKGDANAAVEYLSTNLNVTHLAVLFIRDPYGESYALAIQQAAALVDPPMTCVFSSLVFGASEKETEDAIARIRESGFTYVLSIIFFSQFDKIMTEAQKQGVAGPGYLWIYGDGMTRLNTKVYSKQTQQNLIQATTGCALLTAADPSVLTHRKQFNEFMLEWEAFRTDIEARSYLESKISIPLPDDQQPHQNGTHQTSMFHEMKLPEIPNPYALMLYEAVIAVALASCQLNARDRFFGGPALYREVLERVEFEGPYGSVVIDDDTGTRSFTTVPYTITNIVANDPNEDEDVTFSAFVTDVYSKAGGTVEWRNLREFVYSDGTTTPPIVLPALEEDLNLMSTPARVYAWFLCGFVVILSIGFGIWTHRHRKTRVVAASQPGFLLMLCCGTGIMALAIIPMSVQEPLSQRGLNIACMSMPWLFSIGFVVAFSALFSKTRRINKIFKSKTFNKVKVNSSDVMRPFLILMVVNINILVSWTVIAPRQYSRQYTSSTDEFRREFESYGTCAREDQSVTDILFMVLWILPNFLSLAYANHQAYEARSIATEYSESRYIALSMASIIQAVLIGCPLMFISLESPTMSLFAFATVVFVICIAILMPILVPKILYLRAWNKQKRMKEKRKQLRLRRLELFDSLRSDNPLTASFGLKVMEVSQVEALQQMEIEAELAKLKRVNSFLMQEKKRYINEMDYLSGRRSIQSSGHIVPSNPDAKPHPRYDGRIPSFVFADDGAEPISISSAIDDEYFDERHSHHHHHHQQHGEERRRSSRKSVTFAKDTINLGVLDDTFDCVEPVKEVVTRIDENVEMIESKPSSTES